MRPARDNTSEFLSRLEPFVDADGARNLNPISKELELPYQTLRFRMLHLADQGITVIPILDLAALGLERYRIFFKLADPKLASDFKPFFSGLHQSAGLKYYSRSMLTQKFDCEFCVPENAEVSLFRLLRMLEENGMIEGPEAHKIDWKDVLMLRTQFFDFSTGQWDVDFSRLAGDPSVKIPTLSQSTRFDYNDLLILKELELNAWSKVVDIAKRIDIPERDVAYHLNKHVLGRKLIANFRFKWIGTKEALAKHTVIALAFLFKQIPPEQARHAMSIFTANPFTWNHLMTKDGMYMVETLIPVGQLPESLQYISARLRSLNLEPTETYYSDWNCASGYTIPYMMYDRDGRSWNFNAEKALEYTLESIKTYSS